MGALSVAKMDFWEKREKDSQYLGDWTAHTPKYEIPTVPYAQMIQGAGVKIIF